MSELNLERGYRRLLAWYPRGFRAEQEEEMLGVLMASARDGQRRPGLMDSLDVLRGALRIRARSLRSGPENRGWADGLALFGVLAPVFLVAVSLLEVAVPYQLRTAGSSVPAPLLRYQSQIGGPHLLSSSELRVTLIGQVIVAALVLLGLRRLALIAMAGAAARTSPPELGPRGDHGDRAARR